MRKPTRLNVRDKIFFTAIAFSLLVNVWMVNSVRSEIAAMRNEQRQVLTGGTEVGPGGQNPQGTVAPSSGAIASSGGSGVSRTGARAPLPASKDKAGVSATSIKIGALVTQSGLGDQTPIMRGLSAWVQHVNANGGVGGRKLQLTVEDDGSDTSRGSAALRKLVEQDKVFALVAECAPLSDAQNLEYLKKQGVPVIGSCILPTKEFFTNPYQFPLRVTPDTNGRMMGKYAVKAMGSTTPGLVTMDQQPLTEIGNGVIAQWDDMGITNYVVEQVSVVQPNYTSSVVRMRSAGVDNVILNLDAASTVRFLQSAGQQQWHPKMIGLTAFDEGVRKYSAQDAEGIVIPEMQEMVTENTPYLQEYRAIMHKFYPQEKQLQMAMNGYTPARVFTDVLGKLGKDITRGKLVEAFNSLTDYFDGTKPAYTLRPGRQETQKATKWAVIKGGEIEYVKNDWWYLDR